MGDMFKFVILFSIFCIIFTGVSIFVEVRGTVMVRMSIEKQ
jgi:hypothetical protein